MDNKTLTKVMKDAFIIAGAIVVDMESGGGILKEETLGLLDGKLDGIPLSEKNYEESKEVANVIVLNAVKRFVKNIEVLEEEINASKTDS